MEWLRLHRLVCLGKCVPLLFAEVSHEHMAEERAAQERAVEQLAAKAMRDAPATRQAEEPNSSTVRLCQSRYWKVSKIRITDCCSRY